MIVQGEEEQGNLPAENGQEGSLRLFKHLGKVLKLLRHEETSSSLFKLESNHGRMRTVSSAESIVDVNIGKRRQVFPEFGDFLWSCLDLVPA